MAALVGMVSVWAQTYHEVIPILSSQGTNQISKGNMIKVMASMYRMLGI